ncbi:hypothetical protein PENSPDRAFT_586692 [Peniophora sp. CONT]|nr:hypothetical protein PENSPDRAFT_586692 [Peniophora sp. CONT]
MDLQYCKPIPFHCKSLRRLDSAFYASLHRIAELQATTIVRRDPAMRITSFRLHPSVPHSAEEDMHGSDDPTTRSRDIWR